MATPAKQPQSASCPETSTDRDASFWRPPLSERITVAVMASTLAGALGFAIVFAILRWEVKTDAGSVHRFSTRDPLWWGLLSGLSTFFVTSGSIVLCSMIRIHRRLRGARLVISFCGTLLAGLLGFWPGYTTVCETPSFEEQVGWDLARWRGPSQYVVMNEAKAQLASYGTAADCGGFAGVSLFLLFDRRAAGKVNEPNTAANDKERKQA